MLYRYLLRSILLQPQHHPSSLATGSRRKAVLTLAPMQVQSMGRPTLANPALAMPWMSLHQPRHNIYSIRPRTGGETQAAFLLVLCRFNFCCSDRHQTQLKIFPFSVAHKPLDLRSGFLLSVNVLPSKYYNVRFFQTHQ